MTPLFPWDAKPPTEHSLLVWRAILDRRYIIEVRRNSTESSGGKLHLFDHDKGDAHIAEWEATFSFGAVFGPDASDVHDWQTKVTDFIDNEYDAA